MIITLVIIYIVCLLLMPEATVWTTLIVGLLGAMAALFTALHFLPIPALIGA